ncbi:MAG: response regulator [Acidobacteria bacterium]|nr:response regulator [Acidobacteriota bacterium]
MTIPTTARTLANRLAAALLLGALARVLLLNAPSMADGLVLRLDETVMLFAAMALGGPWGAVTSLTATLGTPEPAYSALWATEALLVGVAVRQGTAPVLTTAAYWILVYAIFGSGLVTSPPSGLDPRLLLAKQLVNGTLSAALAQLLLAAPGVRALFRSTLAERAAVPLRTQIARAIVPVSTIPVILLGLGLGTMYGRDLVTDGTNDLATRATTTATRLADYVAAAEGDVRTLAGQLSVRPSAGAELDQTLALHHTGSTSFATMLVSDAIGGILSASSRLTSDAPRPASGLPPVSDRAYFTEPARTGQAFRSEGFPGRGYTSEPILAFSAPYTTADDAFAGVVQGALNLRTFSAWLNQSLAETSTSALVLDRSGQVIASTGPNAAALLVNVRDLAWISATGTQPIAQFSEASAEPGIPPAHHVAVRRDVPSLGWRVYIRRPVAAMQAPLVPFYMLTAGWLLVCMLLATPLASRVSRRITQPIELLAQTAEGIGRGHAVTQPVLPAEAPAEVASLQRELAAMVERLDESVTMLDQKVRERSAELAAVSARSDTLFRAASDGMLVVEPDGRLIEANDAACRMLGYTHDEILTKHMTDLDDGASVVERQRRADEQARTGATRFETTLRTKSGVTLPVDAVVTAMPSGGGRAFVGVRDISERRRADAERAQLESRRRQSQKMEAIGTLAGGIAHDFNNILMLITGSADLASADIPDGHPARPMLDQIVRASQRAEALVRQILAFSRRRDEQRDVVALGPIVKEAVGILRSTLPAMIEIRTRVEDGLPPVQADAVQLHQVLMNLGSNAAHAMREGGGVLAIDVTRDTTPGATRPGICLTVSDTGSGMDAATLERVFEPFVTTKPVGIGTGLGLAVVHGIVTAHGGSIEASSTLNRGTTIRVLLPAAADGATPHAPAATPAEPTSPHRRAHVLVVDDEPELVGLVCRQLARLGYSAQGCAGPAEALETLSADSPHIDVVMSDLAMPKMSGIELAERIRRDHADIAIVLCSGRVTEEDRERAGRAGICEILAKPFASHQLAAVMERSLGATGTRH